MKIPKKVFACRLVCIYRCIANHQGVVFLGSNLDDQQLPSGHNISVLTEPVPDGGETKSYTWGKVFSGEDIGGCEKR